MKINMVRSYMVSKIFFKLTYAIVGELVVSSHFIGGGYLACDHLGFSMGPDGETTFKTGDIYETTSNGRLRWKGRKEDYIQVSPFLPHRHLQ